MNWKRREFGWLRADGEAFLERGAPMSDTGNPAWLVWVRALDSEVEGTLSMAWARDGGDPVRHLSDCTGNPDDGDAWFVHRGDEGWFADAKVAAEHHLTRRDERAKV